MHLKVFLKLKKTLKPSLLGKKHKKHKKNKKKQKNPTGLFFFFNPSFFQPCLGEGGGHDDHVLRNVGQLLDAQVHQPPQHSVLSLKRRETID